MSETGWQSKSATGPLPPPPRAASAATQVASALRDDIIGMVLLPGAPLQDRVLGMRFGVSRTPVREALLRLADEGLVDIFPQSGTFVGRIPAGAIPEALVVRQALEGVTVQEAAERRSSVGLDDAIARQCTMAERGDMRGFHDADEAFHEALANASGYPGIWRLLRSVKVHIDRARRLTLPGPGRMQSVIGEHRRIRDAVRSGDAAAARGAMEAHLNVVIPDVAFLRERHPEYFT